MGAQRLKGKPKSKVYQLVPLASQSLSEHPSQGPLRPTDTYTVTGLLEGHTIVSVPTSTSHNSANAIRRSLEKELKKPVIIVTHNIHFLSVRLLPNKEALKVMKRIEVGDGQKTETLADPSEGNNDTSEKEKMGNGGSTGGDGSGSRPPIHGSSDLGKSDTLVPSSSAESGDNKDGEIEKEAKKTLQDDNG